MASRTILRLTEKYVLAISLVAFGLVFFGAFYLPQDQLVKRKIRDLGDVQQLQPQVNDPHQHGEQGGDHRDAERQKFIQKAQQDSDIKKIVDHMEEELTDNEDKIKRLNSRLQSLKAIRNSRLRKEATKETMQPDVVEPEVRDADAGISLFVYIHLDLPG